MKATFYPPKLFARKLPSFVDYVMLAIKDHNWVFTHANSHFVVAVVQALVQLCRLQIYNICKFPRST